MPRETIFRLYDRPSKTTMSVTKDSDDGSLRVSLDPDGKDAVSIPITTEEWDAARVAMGGADA